MDRQDYQDCYKNPKYFLTNWGFLGLVGFEVTEVVEDVEVVDEAIEVDELDVEVVVIE